MPVMWEKVNNRELRSTSPRGFLLIITPLSTGEWEYQVTWGGQPHRPCIGIRIVDDPYSLDKKKAAVSELRAACDAFVEENAIPPS